MTSSLSFLYRIVERYRRTRFEQVIRDIVDTPAVSLVPGGPTLLSMVHQRDLLPYLLAVKTFASRLPPSRVVTVADPSMTEQGKALLRHHVEGIEITAAQIWRDAKLPIGGTWERLTAIASEVERGYVVQLDADTVTVGAIAEAAEACAANRSFLLASGHGLGIMSLKSAASWARQRADRVQHIQIQAEAVLDRLGGSNWQYARACSGFAGFPQDSFDRGWLYQISETMFAALGERWRDWGSEQVTSNLVCASQPGARLLPHPKYCNADQRTAETAFIHFIGYTRYVSSAYEDAATDFIKRHQPS